MKLLDADPVTDQTGQECCLSVRPDPDGEQPTHLDDHRGRNNDFATEAVEELDTLSVVRVVPIRDRNKWTSVNQNASRHEANSSRRIVL